MKNPHPDQTPDEVIGFDMNSTCMQTGSVCILIDYFKYLGNYHYIDVRSPDPMSYGVAISDNLMPGA